MRIIIQICMKAKHRSMYNMVTIGNKRAASIQFICNMFTLLRDFVLIILTFDYVKQ